MKLPVLLAFVGLAVATRYSGSQVDQQPLDMQVQTYPGFDINLSELRLVRLEGQEPVWMSELEKVRSTRCICSPFLTSSCRSTSRLKVFTSSTCSALALPPQFPQLIPVF